MRRSLLVTSLAGAAALSAVLGFKSLSPAKPGDELTTPAARASASNLPIQQVVLFSSGVGYFQREGSVEGSATSMLRIAITLSRT